MMRMSAERNQYQQTDVYADVNTSYSSDYFGYDASEFSLNEVEKKLGIGSKTVEAPATNSGALNADVMPTQQTLTMNYQREYQSNTSAAVKLSTKTKVAIVCYTAVVLLLVLGIAFTSVAVSGMFAQTVALAASYDEALGQVAALEEQIAQDDYAALKARAEELGYVDASEIHTETFYERIETRPAQNFQIETNWFDSLCDWLSGAFGG